MRNRPTTLLVGMDSYYVVLPVNFTRSGNFATTSGSIRELGNIEFLWVSTLGAENSSVYYMRSENELTRPSQTTAHWYAFAVRCLAD